MFKKIISAILVISMLGLPVYASSNFTDIDESHWGYKTVMKLVNDGTVKGYTDGSFRPDNSVTRAEFVKMMGVGNVKREKDFSDVTNAHWGYDYIMTSEFETSDNNFLPDKPITRGETLDLLWKRAGRIKDVIAPSVITDQYGKNKEAISWAYNYKIMIGDDGINLRLNDSLSRVEAAALIVRARETDFSEPQGNFKDMVSENTMKTIFESFNLFDNKTTYEPSKTITNGEMARAMLRLASYEYNLTYSSYVVTKTIDHPYGKDVSIIASNVLGDEFATKEFADKKATVDDTMASMAFAMIKKSNNPVSFGKTNNYYKDLGKITDTKNVFLTFSYENGIELNAYGKIGAGKEVTHKDLAAMLIQFDNLIGTQVIFTTAKDTDGNYINKDAKLNLNVYSYPARKSDYACIIKDVDNYVYDKEIDAKPAYGTYDFAREYGVLFISKLEGLVKHIKDAYGVDVTLDVYPNMVWDNKKGFSLRLLCHINNVTKDINIDDIFAGTLVTPVKGKVKPGMSFFIELQTSYAIFM